MKEIEKIAEKDLPPKIKLGAKRIKNI